MIDAFMLFFFIFLFVVTVVVNECRLVSNSSLEYVSVK